uniref:Glucuronosyltransferase n=1 Tax=Meloidogyne javanica TaxID=6303 RepID=A0A915M302_MELJA
NGCVVYVSFGSVNIDGDMEEGHFAKMISAFKSYSSCKFKVRVGEERPSDGNVDFVKGFINQQKSIYAGVPLICIPSSGDQFYISSLVEHLGIGIYIKAYVKNENEEFVENENFEQQLSYAIRNIIEIRSPHQYNTLHMRERILDDFDNDSELKNKETFLGKIREGI